MFLRAHKKFFKLIGCIKKQSISFLIQSQLGNIFDFFQNNYSILNIVIANCTIYKVFISVSLKGQTAECIQYNAFIPI